MKARKQLDRETQKCIEQKIKEQLEKEERKLVERTMKLALVAARQEFGFGAQRLLRLFLAIGEVAKERYKDPEVFYEHIDHVLIDEVGLPFDRETDEL